MKTSIFSLFVLSLLLSFSGCDSKPSKPVAPTAEGALRVLFVGNSHTEFFFSLPDLVEALCKENGKPIEVCKLVEMGASIDEILAANKAQAQTYFSTTDADGNYFDYIILQEKTPVVLVELEAFQKNCQNIVDMAKANSPGAAIYIYELVSPVAIDDKAEFKEYMNMVQNNTKQVAQSLPNAGILPLGSAIADAYYGKEGYSYQKDGKDLLRFGENTLHMLNDAGFLSSVLIYETIYSDEPRLPAMLPLSTGTGDYDPIEMQQVSTAISNPEALLKIAAKYK